MTLTSELRDRLELLYNQFFRYLDDITAPSFGKLPFAQQQEYLLREGKKLQKLLDTVTDEVKAIPALLSTAAKRKRLPPALQKAVAKAGETAAKRIEKFLSSVGIAYDVQIRTALKRKEYPREGIETLAQLILKKPSLQEEHIQNMVQGIADAEDLIEQGEPVAV